MSQETQTPGTQVSVQVIPVAAGVTPSGRLRVTLVLAPVKAAGGTPVDIAKWPTRIHELLAQGEFRVEIATDLTGPDVRAASSLDPGLVSYPDQPGYQQIASEIGARWTALAKDALGGSASDDRLRAYWQAACDLFPAPPSGAQPPDTPPRPYMAGAEPNVVGTARSDAAILVLRRRGEELQKTLKAAAARPPQPDARAQAAGAQDAGAATAKPAFAVGGKEAADETDWWEKGSYKDLYSKTEDWAKQDEPLNEARRNENKHVHDEAAKLAEDARHRRGQNLDDLLRGEVNTLLQKPLKLHRAMLLPDAKHDDSRLPKGALPRSKVERLPDEQGQARPGGGEPQAAGDLSTIARSVFAALRASPMLSQLFRFSVDIEIASGTLTGALRTGAGDEPPFRYLGLRAVIGDRECCAPPVWTAAKLSWPGRDSAAKPAFWPVTMEEITARAAGDRPLADVRRDATAHQINGLVDLGCATRENGRTANPRYDIIVLDPVAPLEAEQRRQDRIKNAGTAHARLNTPALEQDPRGAFDETDSSAMISRGLAVVDRWRAEAVAEQIRNSAGVPAILDADDLMIGYRLDLAVRNGVNDEPEWTSLMEREIDYRVPGQETGPKDDFRTWFDRLSKAASPAETIRFETEHRRDLDEGMMMPTARRRLLDPPVAPQAGPGATAREMVHAEEIIAAWAGDPLGLNCGADTVELPAGTDLAITRRFGLPSSSDEWRRKTWPLRYGWAYRFGMRAVWAGGVSRSRGDAAAHGYDLKDPRSHARPEPQDRRSLALPQPPATRANLPTVAYRRFLRHEPIRPPVAMLPINLARADLELPLAPQSGLRAVLRSLAAPRDEAAFKDKYGATRETLRTTRIILPPKLSLDEAVRHGVFGAGAVSGDTAPGNYARVNCDEQLGPVRADGRVSGAPQLKDLKSSPQRVGFPIVGDVEGDRKARQEKDNDAWLQRAGESCFQVYPTGAPAKARDASSHYYADPMADQLVVAIRTNTNVAGQGYFEGEPHVFDVAPSTAGGDILPVELVFEKAASALRRPGASRGRPVRQSEFWDAPQPSNKTVPVPGGAADTMPGRSGTIRLFAGESVQVECWYVPSEQKLRAFFDLPETLAVLAAADDATATTTSGEAYLDALLTILRDRLGATAPNKAARQKLEGYAGKPAWAGLGGVAVHPVLVAEAARILHRHLLMRPLPEIACVRTISATHAVARPPRAPALLTAPAQRLRVFRAPVGGVNDEANAARLETLRGIYAQWSKLPSQAAATPDAVEKDLAAYALGKPGETGIAIAGIVEIDRDTCRDAEVLAWCVPPTRLAIDDPARGRTELQRLLGEWPERIVPIMDGSKPEADRAMSTRAARHLFGFDVTIDGTVRLPRRWIQLSAIDALAEQVAASDFTKPEPVDLLGEELAMLARRSGPAGPETQSAFQRRLVPAERFVSARAHKLIVATRATSRFDAHFLFHNEHEQPGAPDPTPEHIFPPDPTHADLIARVSFEGSAEELRKAAESVTDATPTRLQTLWVHATIAPSKPEVHAVLPAYAHERGAWTRHGGAGKVRVTLTREPRIRIYLDRPWYSTGEGERLGLVLWPPQLDETLTVGRAAGDGARKMTATVRRKALGVAVAGQENDSFGLPDFRDSDLGRGGRFVTRLGLDPIHAPTEDVGPLLTKDAFLDWKGGTFAARFVPRVAIPLEDIRTPDGDASVPAAATPAQVERLQAALLTFEPKFDVEMEKWFVDLRLDPLRMMTPFLRLGLVRYQEHAAPDLQVSAPVVAWAQIEPPREVLVEAVRPDGGRSGKLTVSVTVKADAASARAGRRIEVGLLACGKTSEGEPDERLVRSVVLQEPEQAATATTLQTATATVTAARRARRPLSGFRSMETDIPVEAGPTETDWAVVIEETALMPSTQDERTGLPVAPGEAADPPPPAAPLAEAGPRFLARLDFKA